MGSPSRSMCIRTAALCLLIALGGAATSLSGCTGTEPAPRPAAPPTWRIDLLRRALPAVVLVRGRQLCVERLDSPTTTPIWTAPAETTPTILAVDQPGGRIALLLRAEPTVKFAPEHFLRPPDWSDAGIVVLSADGSARRYSVRALTTPIHLAAETLPLTITSRPTGSVHTNPHARMHSIEATVPDLITSGAFLGDGLVLTTESGVTYRWGRPHGTPLRLTARGLMLPLSDPASATSPPLVQFCELAGGGVVAVRESDRFFGSPTQHSAALVGLRGSALVTTSPAYDVGYQMLGPVGSADGAQSFVYRYGRTMLDAFVVVSLEACAWRTKTIDLRQALNFSQWGLGPDIALAQSGPRSGLLAPVRAMGGGHLLLAPGEEAPPEYSNLVPLSIEATVTAQPTPVRVLVEDDLRTRTWIYLTRFGPRP